MVMLSRFYLGLRKSSLHTSTDLSDVSVSDLRFAHVMDGLGETLSHQALGSSLECVVTTDEYVFVEWEGSPNLGD